MRLWIVAAAVVLVVAGGTTGATGALASPALTVRITSAPPGTATTSVATFSWIASETARFTCSLDGAAAACSSPTTYSGLAAGVHVFLVTATNTDRGGVTYTARATHRWTVDLPVGPPPPPPSAKTAGLLVTVDGGGTVVSQPAGIDCPGDCEQSFPVGTKVTLSQKAGPGARFGGWSGACEGGGACAPEVSATTLVLAAFKATATEPRLYRGDRERDGLNAARDACPFSPRGLKPLLAGCTAVDLLNGADGLVTSVRDALDAARTRTLGVKGLQAVGRDLRAVAGLVGQGASDVSQGDPCRGSATVGKGAGLLTKGSAQLAAMQKQLVEVPPPNGEGDADETDLQLAGLHYRQVLLAQAAGKVSRLQRSYAAVCRSLGKQVELVGRVTRTKDADGLLELANGQDVSLAGADYGADDISEGRRVKIVGKHIGSGPLLAQSVDSVDKNAGKIHVNPCVKLRIAPFQDFLEPNLILHDPAGYSFDNVLRLEAGMRVAASPKCSSAKSGRYSLMIVMSSSSQLFTVAADLDSNDPPVDLPVGGSATLWSIRVYERYQAGNCPPPSSSQSSNHDARTTTAAVKSFPCPAKVVSTTAFKARVLDAGVYGQATYEKTIFPLESNAPQTTKVEAIYPLHYTIQPGKATFEGEGYKPGGSPGPLVTVKLNETFALWPDSYYGAPLLFMVSTIGVDHFAGLLWPRIVGTRKGHPFRYTAQLPNLVKDQLPDCPNGLLCLYRLPWKVSTAVGTAQGNGPGFSHNGNQLYAFDFSMSDGATIYATRGGVVGDLVESNSMNFNPCADNNGNGVKGDEQDKKADGPTNYVRIDHGDGTYSYYAHVQVNSVIPAEGTLVERGDPIASVGNVGRSCGPHLHYQVASDSTNTIYGQTVLICFEGWRFIPPVSLDFYHCYNPVKGDSMLSTNG